MPARTRVVLDQFRARGLLPSLRPSRFRALATRPRAWTASPVRGPTDSISAGLNSTSGEARPASVP